MTTALGISITDQIFLLPDMQGGADDNADGCDDDYTELHDLLAAEIISRKRKTVYMIATSGDFCAFVQRKGIHQKTTGKFYPCLKKN
jgi:hypothetical protein